MPRTVPAWTRHGAEPLQYAVPSLHPLVHLRPKPGKLSVLLRRPGHERLASFVDIFFYVRPRLDVGPVSFGSDRTFPDSARLCFFRENQSILSLDL
jgi:hypothetical protein